MLVSVLVRSFRRVDPEDREGLGTILTESRDDLLSERPDVVVETGGQSRRSLRPGALYIGEQEGDAAGRRIGVR